MSCLDESGDDFRPMDVDANIFTRTEKTIQMSDAQMRVPRFRVNVGIAAMDHR